MQSTLRDNWNKNKAKILAILGEGLALFIAEAADYIQTLLPMGSALGIFLVNTSVIVKIIMAAVIMYVFGNKRELEKLEGIINQKDGELQAASIKIGYYEYLFSEKNIPIPKLQDKDKII